MNANTCSNILSILEAGYREVFEVLKRGLPGPVMQCGHYRNSVFPLRSYCEFRANDRTVVISFDVQTIAGQVKLSGDLSRENGYVLRDLTPIITSVDSVEPRAVEFARKFVSIFESEVALMDRELRTQSPAK
jgi:hypothetical protein